MKIEIDGHRDFLTTIATDNSFVTIQRKMKHSSSHPVKMVFTMEEMESIIQAYNQIKNGNKQSTG